MGGKLRLLKVGCMQLQVPLEAEDGGALAGWYSDGESDLPRL